MATIGNLTATLDNGTSTLTFTPISSAAGDGTDAAWTALASGSTLASRHSVSYRAQWNGLKTARRHTVKFVIPDTDANGNVVSRQIYDITVTVPATTTDIKAKDALASVRSILANSLIKDSIVQGYAPT